MPQHSQQLSEGELCQALSPREWGRICRIWELEGVNLWAGDEGMMLGGRNPCVGSLGKDREGLSNGGNLGSLWRGNHSRARAGFGQTCPCQVWMFRCSKLCLLQQKEEAFGINFFSSPPNQLKYRAEDSAGSALCSLPSPLLSSFTSQPILFPLLLLVPDKQISPLPLCKNLFFLCCLIFPFSRTSLISLPALITEMSSFPQPAAARLGQG